MAAYAGVDNFDSYTNGAALNALNGGTGWAGAWTADAGYVVGNSVFQTTPNGIGINSAPNVVATRILSAGVDSGDLYLAVRESAHSADGYMTIDVQNGATKGCTIGFRQSGNLGVLNYAGGGSDTIANPASDGVWYIININFVSATSFRMRWKVAGGTWSAFGTTHTYANSVSSPDRFVINTSKEGGATVFYFDSFGTTDPDAPAAGGGNFLAFM